MIRFLPLWGPPVNYASSSKRVAAWASLFQSRDENEALDKSELG
jgi:hypothetical protein